MGTVKRMRPLFGFFLVLFGLLLPGRLQSTESIQPMTQEIIATVTFVEGTPLAGPVSALRSVVSGQVLYSGSRIQTDGGSRIELATPGGGIVRLAGETILELGSKAGAVADGLTLTLLKGDMWANFSNQQGVGACRILVSRAMIVGPESVFRMVALWNGDIEVKTYSGLVTTSGPFDIQENIIDDSLPPDGGGEEDTLEAWCYQIAPYQKLIVLSAGYASKPFRFAAHSDLTDWVRWNQQRDEIFK